MNSLQPQSRRKFIQLSSAMLGGLPLIHTFPVFGKSKAEATNLKVHIFSKHLQFLDYLQMAEAAKTMGFDGIDLTLRPKGHVLPERVEDDLPKAVAAMQEYGLEPSLFATGISSATDEQSVKVLQTASQLGFTYYRMGWLKYPEERTIPESIQLYREQFRQLANLNEKLGMSAGYQNHAGNHVGAPVWDLYHLLEGIAAEQLGCQYDIRHATVEGGSDWELGLRLIRSKITSIVIKDFIWGKVHGKWKPVNMPLGEGMVDFKSFFSLLKKYNINVPVSLHYEYELGGAEKGNATISISKEEVFQKMRQDLQFLRNTWEATE